MQGMTVTERMNDVTVSDTNRFAVIVMSIVGGSTVVAGVTLVKADVRTCPKWGMGRVGILNRKGNAGKVMEIEKKSWGKEVTIRETEAC